MSFMDNLQAVIKYQTPTFPTLIDAFGHDAAPRLRPAETEEMF